MNSKSIFQLIVKYRVSIIVLVLAAGVCSFIFSSRHFITPLYKSVAVLFPSSNYSSSRAIMNTSTLYFVDPLKIGDDKQTEEMLQVLNSNIIMDKIIEKYDLANHYGIKKGKYETTRLYDKYKSNISFRRTEYNAVKIVVYDHDPNFACQIANDIAELFDNTMDEMQKELSAKALDILKKECQSIQDEITKLEDSIHSLSRYGVYDYDLQLRTLSEQLSVETARNNIQAINNLKKEMAEISKYGTLVDGIKSDIEALRLQLATFRQKYSESKIDASQTLPHKFLISPAYVPERTAFPVRWVIITISMISIFIMTTFFILAIEGISENKHRNNG